MKVAIMPTLIKRLTPDGLHPVDYTADSLLEAARFVADAKLDLADTAESRVEALELTLKIAMLVEKVLQDQVDKGFGSKGDLARAKLARLSVEVELLKAKGK